MVFQIAVKTKQKIESFNQQTSYIRCVGFVFRLVLFVSGDEQHIFNSQPKEISFILGHI
jgi:hypothetical protein